MRPNGLESRLVVAVLRRAGQKERTEVRVLDQRTPDPAFPGDLNRRGHDLLGQHVEHIFLRQGSSREILFPSDQPPQGYARQLRSGAATDLAEWHSLTGANRSTTGEAIEGVLTFHAGKYRTMRQ